ncbi:MAG: hypothetical protein D6813_02660 [Calditrichaeota bacterium]|nr:MAG: hypothetical protein D6813_02660 [Calditrichota bacterium]
MASEEIIKTQIEQLVGGEYSKWTIGITEDPLDSKARHGNPLTWCHWKAESSETAHKIKKYFLQKGMQSGGKETNSAIFVYVF